MLKVGDTIRFIPDIDYGPLKPNQAITGRIAYINRRHRYFLIEYKTAGGIMRQCHKFVDGEDRDFSNRDPAMPRQIQSKHGCAIF